MRRRIVVLPHHAGCPVIPPFPIPPNDRNQFSVGGKDVCPILRGRCNRKPVTQRCGGLSVHTRLKIVITRKRKHATDRCILFASPNFARHTKRRHTPFTHSNCVQQSLFDLRRFLLNFGVHSSGLCFPLSSDQTENNRCERIPRCDPITNRQHNHNAWHVRQCKKLWRIPNTRTSMGE